MLFARPARLHGRRWHKGVRAPTFKVDDGERHLPPHTRTHFRREGVVAREPDVTSKIQGATPPGAPATITARPRAARAYP